MKTIRELRTERGWSQQDLAERLQVSLSSVYNWERGSFEPRASQFIELGRIFDVPLETIKLIIETDSGHRA